MRVRIYRDRPSNSAVELGRSTGYKALKIQGSTFRARHNDVIINWGCTSVPDYLHNAACVLNKPELVANACDKLKAFDSMLRVGVRVPDFCVDPQVARQWQREGHTVVVRKLLRASSGRGIVVCSPNDELPDAPLYVKYIKKQDEYRVHVLGGRVIDVQRKMRTYSVPDEDVNWQIRNHINGFVFGRTDVEINEDTRTQAVQAVRSLSLDFGAVDVVWNEHQQKCYVLEVNTAPGLEGTTLEKYSDAFTLMLT